MTVTNINGTSPNKCKCGSWIQHWRNYSGQTARICRAKGCSNTTKVGAHVQKDVAYDSKWYIVPFCSTHNALPSTTKIELVAGTNFMSANVSNTCGK